jgi:hypothetical protein
MGLVDHNGEAEFPVNKDIVFDAMCIAIPTIKGLSIASADKFLGRIMVKGGVSLASWGENVPIQLIEINENKTRVSITSSPKTGIMLGGANDMGKNRKNIERILSATSQVLQSGQAIPGQQTIQPSSFNNQSNPSFNQVASNPKKKMSIGKKVLIGIGIFILIGVIGSQMDKSDKPSSITDSPNNSNSTEQVAQPQSPTTSAPPTVDKEQQDEEVVREKLKAKAKKDWPDDYTTQEFWVNEEIEAYKYMKTIPDGSVKRKAQHDWPLDFSTQKFWYNEQVEAKERMQ